MVDERRHDDTERVRDAVDEQVGHEGRDDDHPAPAAVRRQRQAQLINLRPPRYSNLFSLHTCGQRISTKDRIAEGAPLLKIAPCPEGIRASHNITQLQRHLDWFIRFSTAHQQTLTLQKPRNISNNNLRRVSMA